LLVAACGTAYAAAGDTLALVKSRGVLRCGVSAGICAKQGRRVSFVTFLRYGVPITLCQLAVAALYVLAFAYIHGG